MALTDLAENAFLDLLFDNVAWANIGDAGGLQPSVGDGSLYIALFTASPTDTGSTAAEAAFTNYARQPVSRTAGFTVTGNQVENAGIVTFPQSGSGPETISHFAIMTAVTGGDMIAHGAVDASRTVNNGTTLRFSAGQLVINVD